MEPVPPPGTGNTSHEQPGRVFWVMMFLSLIFVGGVAYLQYSRVDRARRGGGQPIAASTLPIYGELPDFALIERDGRQITRKSLLGHIWVADFVFTYCGGPCPIMTRRMRMFSDELLRDRKDKVLCVSISVDPQRDTPEVLQQYAAKNNASPTRWLFLTGEKGQIRDLAVKSFKLGVQDPPPGEDQILHSTRFVLVDRAGRIRGYYRVLDDGEEEDPLNVPIDRGMPEDEKKRLMLDIQTLMREGSR